MKKNKIAIITTFNMPNWGSILQAYALQKNLEIKGFDVTLLDYKYPNEFHWKRGFKWIPKPIGLKRKIAVMLGLRPKTRMMCMNSFISSEMKLSKPIKNRETLKSYGDKYDIYIAGSDQIWNPNTMYGDTSYMLDFVDKSKLKISYASSIACNKIPNELFEKYYDNLSKFSYLSVREKNGEYLIKEKLKLPCTLVLDPTLLLRKDKWHEIASKAKFKRKIPEKYILLYMLTYAYNDNPEKTISKMLKRIYNEYKIPIISLTDFKEKLENLIVITENDELGIPEFLFLFENAEIIITSSFHGVAFSINFGKTFIPVLDATKKEDDRISSLLKLLGLDSIILYTNSNVNEYLIHQEYDKIIIDKKLETYRVISESFLNESLKINNK